jgi:hypothetical protein
VQPATKRWRENGILWLPLLPALAVVAYRAGAQPLFGVDTSFRWNFLAQQMFDHGTLAFYPPVTGADYEIYAWPDGIAPAVSSLYFALYLLAGATRPTLTAPVVVFQFIALLGVVHALAKRDFSTRAAAFACALVAASPVVLWSAGMGQESALIAIAVLAMLRYLPRDATETSGAPFVIAGLAAGLAGLAREYGILFSGLGLGLCLARRLPRRGVLLFATAAAIAIIPWYFRNWIRTGNPVFSLSVANFFPVNRVHEWLQQSYTAEYGWQNLAPGAGQILLTNGALALLLGGVGAALYFRAARASILVAVTTIAIWAASVAYTAAGFTYSLRALTPALALAAVLGGAAAASWVPSHRYLGGAAIALSLLATDAALRALTLPANVYRLPPKAWLNVGRSVIDYHARSIYPEIVRVAGKRRILTLGPTALLSRCGGHTLPLWSPEVDFLFDEQSTPAAIANRLLAANIGFILLNQGSVNERLLAHSSFFREPAGTLRHIWSDEDMVLLGVNSPAPP